MFSNVALRPLRWVVCIAIVVVISCRSGLEVSSSFSDQKIVHRLDESYAQDTSGDPEKGFQYMIYGNMVGNGIPWEVNKQFFGTTEDTVLEREGLNGKVPHSTTVFEVEPDIPVVSGNCFTCHSQKLNGEYVLGLGNSFSDYTRSLGPMLKGFNFMVKRKYGKDSREWKRYREQGKWFEAIAKATVMPNPGMSPAFRLEEAAVAYRHKDDLSYKAQKNFRLEKPSIGTDVPPLWNVKKKKVLYYTGLGRGDFSKLIMQVSVLGVHDSTQAREIQQNFVDVLAWLNQLEAPAYPGEVDQKLAAKGKEVFTVHCSKCHGTYGEDEYYPNKIIPIRIVKTDPMYAEYNLNSKLMDWYNESWFATSAPRARDIPSYGYVAPPLDGIWATAPYLHNGSVPDLRALLDSRQRPTYWSRSGDSRDYDLERVGWKYEEKNNGRGDWTYDGTKDGSGNQGHYFGDILSEKERTAVIEYLKTL